MIVRSTSLSRKLAGLFTAVVVAGSLISFDTSVRAQDKKPDAKQVFLRVEPNGPTSPITALVFSADGKRLFAAGFDKVVRVWDVDADKGTFTPNPVSYRVPVGPGTSGTINALALSSDGKWLAAGGVGWTKARGDYCTGAMIFPTR